MFVPPESLEPGIYTEIGFRCRTPERMATNSRQEQLEEGVEQQSAYGRKDFEARPPDSADFMDRIAHFTWPWFACTMSTDAMAVVIANMPNRFDGLDVNGTIFFIVDLVLFVLFNIAMGLRAFWFPRRFRASLHHPVGGLFFGSY